MSELRYTEDHEWVRIDDDRTAVVGITDYAQEQLGEIVFIELPEVGDEVERGAEAAVIESVKAASELFAPVSGTVVKVNEALSDEPALVNEDPVGEGWFVEIELDGDGSLEGLMTEEEYFRFVEGLE
jgi:glycine cleavage system H protein